MEVTSYSPGQQKQSRMSHHTQPLQELSGYDFSNSGKTNLSNSQFRFGPRDSESLSVDQTLATLFDTLTVECSGVLVQPQWKHFRHIHMLKKDRIRLSNGIWRSWHLQFQKCKKPLYCQFVIDLKLEHHKSHEAVVLEGKYWNREKTAVATEYRKWRVYYHKKNKIQPHDPFLDSVREKANKVFEESQRQRQEVTRPPQSTSFLQHYNDFQDPLLGLMDISPSVDYSTDVVLPRPNLDMLNPTLDDFLNRLEPMDVGLPRSLAGGSSATGAFTSPYHTPLQANSFMSSVQQVQNPTISFSTPLVTASLVSQTNSTPTPFSQLDTHTQKSPSGIPGPMPAPYSPRFAATSQIDQFQPPQTSQTGSVGLGQDGQHYSVSPTSFLNISPDSPQQGQSEHMDLGINFQLKSEPLLDDGSALDSSRMAKHMYRPTLQDYQQEGRESQGLDNINHTSAQDILRLQSSLQHDVNNIEGEFSRQYVQGEATPSQSYLRSGSMQAQTSEDFQFPSSNVIQSASSSQGQFPTQPSVCGDPRLFGRVSSAGNLGLVSAMAPHPSNRPPLERGKSEPIRRLHEQVQKLSAENEKQLVEIDKQKNFAEKQYLEILHTVLQQQAVSGKTSEQQQQMLQSIISDPSLVGILRNVFLNTPSVGGASSAGEKHLRQDLSEPSTPNKLSLTELHMRRDDLVTRHITPPFGQVGDDMTSPPSIVSPTDLAKMTGVSDFQSRLLVAAASQAAQSSYPGGSLTSTAMLSPYSNYLSGGSDSESTPSGSQLRPNPLRKLNSEEKETYRELRRQSHISAEQKRRGSIKHGFDHLQSLVVNISAYPSGKVSKAVVLEKTLEHIRHSHLTRSERDRKVEGLKKEIEDLTTAIARCQEMLPASGVPVTRQRFEENRQRFRDYIQRRTQQNYKFWIFSIILKQLFGSYNSMVSTGSVDELCRTVLAWFQQNCTLPTLRPVVMSSLRELSQKTSILTDPSQVPRQLAQYAEQEMQLHRQEQEKARTGRSSFS